MATYNVVLDASNSNNFTFSTLGNGTADTINIYITEGYAGEGGIAANFLADDIDTINFIIDPAYRPAGNASLFYSGSSDPAYLVLSGSPTYYVELNSGNTGPYGGYFTGTTNISSGPPPSWYVPPKDYTVEGTGGYDVITTSYTGDPEGDRVDNSDAANGSQDDLIYAYGGNDYIDSQLGRDTVYGGTGNDIIHSGAGSDRVFGDSGNDTIYSGADSDTVYGGTGNDTMDGGTGTDRLYGDSGDDRFLLNNSFGADTIVGGETSESTGDVLDMSGLTVGVTVDLTSSNPESGTISDGASTATFSQIENIILGGGRDTVVLADGSGADSVLSFDMTDSGDGTTNDQLDVSGLTSDGGTTPVNTSDVVVTDTNGDGTGDAILTFPGGESITLVGVSPSQLDTTESLVAIGIPAGQDYTVSGTAGDDLIDGAYTGDPEGDMVDANDAADGSNNDVIEAGAGNDTVLAGAGDDTIDGGAGNDTLTGGAGDDVFVYQPGDGADVITDFGAGNTGAINDGDQQNNDLVDLSAFYNSTTLADVNANGGNFATELGMLRADAADGTLDGIIDGVDYSAQIGDINLTLENAGVAFTGTDLTFDNTNVVCFTSGTLIETDRGPVPIEDISVGDLVLTKDDGLQPVRWIGSRKVGEDVLCQHPNLRPIRIAARSLGCGLPKRDLLVSPQHRMLIRSQIADRMFGENEVLVAAKHLTAFDGIEIAEDQPTVTYWHFMFDRHQVVFAEGAESESLYAGKEALSSIPIESLREIHTLFPEVSEGKVPSPARKLVKGRQGRRLAERHHTNRRPLFQSTLPKPGDSHEVRI
ncbi:Hint domain-containing protein [Marivivens marinus]|uniref:Hint domain-containing protein n=1 Tax=Marivivens marinus TaxID=3110173 RepID=UPI003B848530